MAVHRGARATRFGNAGQIAGCALALLCADVDRAAAQLDPLLVIKSTTQAPSGAARALVIVALDLSPRMQSDAAGHYYDPVDYAPDGITDTVLGLSPARLESRYRRRYDGLQAAGGADKYITSTITTVGDREGAPYTNFFARSRLGVARAALARVVRDNTPSVRFGLVTTRQQAVPAPLTPGNDGPVLDQDPRQQSPSELPQGRWQVTTAITASANRDQIGGSAPLVAADVASANSDLLRLLAMRVGAAPLVAAGFMAPGLDDGPIATLLTDASIEARRLIDSDTSCRNVVIVLVTGGGEATGGHDPTASAVASRLQNVGGRRVPLHVVAIAPPSSADAELRAIATAGGGQYSRVDQADIDAAYDAAIVSGGDATVPVAAAAVETAVQHALADPADVNQPPTAGRPYGPASEYQLTGPVVGTVDLAGARYADGRAIADATARSSSGTVLPQRSNLLVTSAFALPGFSGVLRGVRVYRAVADATRDTGVAFVSDGGLLWSAHTPRSSDGRIDPASRNIFTALPDGTIVPFVSGNAAVLEKYLRPDGFDAGALIDWVRAQPIGAIVGSTPAILSPPSLDPDPDGDYALFRDRLRNRRALVFVGANDGMLHAIDARTGLEVWAFIPFNLLPKLRALRFGQAVDRFVYTMDGSPKVADVVVSSGTTRGWRTVLIAGEGGGGTFYQAFDVTLDGPAACATPGVDDQVTLLGCFSSPGSIPLRWSFPRYAHFDTALGAYGDLDISATNDERSVGQTWSAPSIGRVARETGPFAAIMGSGSFPASAQQTPGRGGVTAGQRVYMLDAADGIVLDSIDVGSDGRSEAVDECTTVPATGCSALKNAIQADVATAGPAGTRAMSRAYVGDLDGNVWRFDMVLRGSQPGFSKPARKLFAAGADQPLFGALATVTVGSRQYLFFGSGSQFLPSTGVNGSYKLFGLIDGASVPSFAFPLTATDGLEDDEKVSVAPVVAGTTVFFTSSISRPNAPCAGVDAALYGLTFAGGVAYDTNSDSIVDNRDSPRIATLMRARVATVPFVADRHLWLGAGNALTVFGDPQAFNADAGDAVVRIVSWRRVP